MQEQIIQLLGDVNGFLWNNIIIALLIIAGVWFTATTRFVQLRQLPEMFRILKSGAGEKSKGDHHISPFQAFCISVASHVGVGNIAGIAIAIALGGPGAVFWMWFIALLGAATSFIENTLGQIYKERLPDSPWFEQSVLIYFICHLNQRYIRLNLQLCTSKYHCYRCATMEYRRLYNRSYRSSFICSCYFRWCKTYRSNS